MLLAAADFKFEISFKSTVTTYMNSENFGHTQSFKTKFCGLTNTKPQLKPHMAVRPIPLFSDC